MDLGWLPYAGPGPIDFTIHVSDWHTIRELWIIYRSYKWIFEDETKILLFDFT